MVYICAKGTLTEHQAIEIESQSKDKTVSTFFFFRLRQIKHCFTLFAHSFYLVGFFGGWVGTMYYSSSMGISKIR